MAQELADQVQGAAEGPAQQAPVVLEERTRLSESMIWRMQRQGYQVQGIDSWRQNAIPFYITTNPYIAAQYAKVVLAYLRDCAALAGEAGGQQGLDTSEPVYIVELGAGPGRFGFYFLKQFEKLHRQSRVRHIPFTYVMTDFADSNIAYWREHSHLKPFVDAGLLDFAHFDVESGDALDLVVSGRRLEAGSLRNPLAVIANYVFDSVPHDLFSIQGGVLSERLGTLVSAPAEDPSAPADVLSNLQATYESAPLSGPPYADDARFNTILDEYARRLGTTEILFPTLTLRCLNRLRRIAASDRLLLISADKGYSREEDLLALSEPYMASHGAVFSMMVNFHAMGRHFELGGGAAFHPTRRHSSINISAFASGYSADDLVETRGAYDDALDALSPDDFFVMVTTLRENTAEQLKPETALALVRLSQWDVEVLLRNLPAFLDNMDGMPTYFKEELAWTVNQVWEMYYPIGEEWDAASYMSMLLYSMGYYTDALTYLERSLALYGPFVTTYHNMALCHAAMRQPEQAMECVAKALEQDPTYDASRALQLKLQAEFSRNRHSFRPAGAMPAPAAGAKDTADRGEGR